MDVPDIVRERLGDERRMTSVNVGGDDRVYVTPPRTLVYRASGLFSREAIEEYPHDARRFDVSADRREANFAFEYDDGVRGFSVPRERIETVLPPVLAGVLRTTGLIDPEESVEESYRFGERTLVVTDARLLTSAGEAVWDEANESYEYESVTGLRYEDGTLVIEIDGRPRRIEFTGEGRRDAYETVEAALLAYHGVAAVEDLPQAPERDRQQASAGDGTAVSETEPDGRIHETSGQPDGSEVAGAPDAETSAARPPRSPAPTGQSPDPPIREAPESSDPDTPRTPAEAAPDTSESLTEAAPDASTQPEATEPPHATDTERDGTGDTDGTADLTGELDALRESVERQTELLERQQDTLERLVEEVGGRRSADSENRNDPDLTDDR